MHMDQQIWRWTLTKEAVAPCFVRDVLAMRRNANGDADFFWLGHTPCRTVLLVGMVVGIQVYDKRAIYTIDDGTAVIDCILRHRHPTPPEPKPRSPPRSNRCPAAKSNLKCPSPKKPRLDKAKVESTEPPPPITEPGYPVRVVGRVVKHYQSKQIHADTIDPCPSSLDELAHLERVIELHKSKYSSTVPFILPHKPTSRTPPLDMSTNGDVGIFSNTSITSPSTAPYTLPPPPMPVPAQSRNRPLSVPTHLHSAYHDHTRVPSSPTASSIASSTPSSPCKLTSPVKVHNAPRKPKLRHPSRLHTRDLTGNTFRLYLKHYMDNAPPSFPISVSSPSRSTCGVFTTPTKYKRDEDEIDEPTPRPRPSTRDVGDESQDKDKPMLGFTLSHLRRVPELALLAARVVRAEVRRREKADREKEKDSSRSRIPASALADPPRKKIKRLFSWAVVKLYEEGSIILWDGDVRPFPMPPPPVFAGSKNDESELWKGDTQIGDPSMSCTRSYFPGDSFTSTFGSTFLSTSASMLYTLSASASLYSHYHPPRRPAKRRSESHHRTVEAEVGAKAEGEAEADDVDVDADPGNISDPGMDEEAYVPLTPQLLAGYVRQAVSTLRCGRERGGASTGANGRGGGTRTEPTPEHILAYLQRKDSRWGKVGIWAVEEALAVLKAG